MPHAPVSAVRRLVIDLTWVGRYMQVAYWHPDPVARLAGKQRLFLLSPGTLLFLLAYFLGNYPDQGDAFLAAVLGNVPHRSARILTCHSVSRPAPGPLKPDRLA